MIKSFFQKFEKILKRPISLIVLVLFGLTLFLLKDLHLSDVSPFWLSFGRLHPIFLHFPLVLICLALVVELLKYFTKFKLPDLILFYGYLLTILITLISVFSGYFLFSNGEYTGFLMDQHFNGALITAFLLIVTFVLFVLSNSHKKFYSLYLIFLLAANGTVLYTGHQGGSITHGRNYLSEYLPMINAEDEPLGFEGDSVRYLYTDVIQPVFETKCAGCHHNLRAEGDFSVASFQDLFVKGESGKMPIVPNSLDESELLVRIMMPDSLNDHMPPEGKTPLDEKEIEILKYWIVNGALEDFELSDSSGVEIQTAINQMVPALKKYHFNLLKTKLNNLQIEENLMALAKVLEVVIKKDPDEDGSKYILSNLFPPVPFDGNKLSDLKPYLELFTKVSLVSSQINDADLYLIGQMSNLKELYLQKTELKGEGLIHLSALGQLEVLNISFTETDDKSIIDLIQFPALKEVFLYNTKTTNEVIQAIEGYKPSLKIYSEEGPYL